jgi:predicted nucleotide-binding protein (sugar kinase/HSP70/actin superfamily)
MDDNVKEYVNKIFRNEMRYVPIGDRKHFNRMMIDYYSEVYQNCAPKEKQFLGVINQVILFLYNYRSAQEKERSKERYYNTLKNISKYKIYDPESFRKSFDTLLNKEQKNMIRCIGDWPDEYDELDEWVL